jgi:RNA polymerase sigma factor (sigma-70 family)
MKTETHKDQKYIEALLQNNSSLLDEIYQKFAHKIVRYISQNSGDADAAQDIIQETLVTIYHQAKEKDLVLTVPFDAYFFLLCKRRWLNELKKRGKTQVTNIDEFVSISDDAHEQVAETELYESRSALFQSKLKLLNKSCQDLLEKVFAIQSMQKVAEVLGVSYGYARKKKSQCIGKLTELVRESAAYQQLKNL